MARRYTWLDTGTHGSMLDARNFVRTLTERQVQQVGSSDEVAFEMGWIDKAQLEARFQKFGNTDYRHYLAQLSVNKNKFYGKNVKSKNHIVEINSPLQTRGQINTY